MRRVKLLLRISRRVRVCLVPLRVVRLSHSARDSVASLRLRATRAELRVIDLAEKLHLMRVHIHAMEQRVVRSADYSVLEALYTV